MAKKKPITSKYTHLFGKYAFVSVVSFFIGMTLLFFYVTFVLKTDNTPLKFYYFVVMQIVPLPLSLLIHKFVRK